MFQMRHLLLIKKKRELSEYKAIYIIKDYFLLLYQALQKDTQDISKILVRLFNLLQRNGRKSHRYEKKTVFDIIRCRIQLFHAPRSCGLIKNLKPTRDYLVCKSLNSLQ
ncbi:Transposase for insertion sequence element IS231B [Bacillus mycoides]|nr:Transposase for insertion sequence element IS231B [Bacillus mycoides]GAE43082.1 putative transposase [Bacillus mycoides NBRC 101238 = DSM 11821]